MLRRKAFYGRSWGISATGEMKLLAVKSTKTRTCSECLILRHAVPTSLRSSEKKQIDCFFFVPWALELLFGWRAEVSTRSGSSGICVRAGRYTF